MSVWIDWRNGRAHPATDRLDQLLDEPIQLVLCDRVVQEIVQGIRDDRDAREVEKSSECLIVSTPADASQHWQVRRVIANCANKVSTFVAAMTC